MNKEFWLCYGWWLIEKIYEEKGNCQRRIVLQTKIQKQFGEETLAVICKTFQASMNEITDMMVMKKGMTNQSFTFRCRGKQYMIRISGAGTQKLINRYQEKEVYETIKEQNICDPIIYINPENGCKITEFLENSRVCDPMNDSDVKRSIQFLRNFHKKKLVVGHDFDIFGQIENYQTLWGTSKSVYEDYEETKKKVYFLKSYINHHATEKVLTHIDAVPDNFLFIKDGQEETIRLIDWEYAGMQDPHVDIAMFGIYSLYDRNQMEKLIDTYFTEGCEKEVRVKIHCYIAACGLLWSNWCEYKEKLGISFGDYAIRQYQYAKEYSRIAQMELEEIEETSHA